ncbi:MAG TPA: hypothetical protein VF665_13770 [Longimicrobium sp.]|jgi:hypothetical protein|uniref:hypothetical protein n=1 Tax=Longimicrobium sp. TaxID=2029185 RepID=UPI002ED8C77D
MKSTKLKLDLDALQIASFATQASAADAKGTVNANSDPVSITLTIGTLITRLLCTTTE